MNALALAVIGLLSGPAAAETGLCRAASTPDEAYAAYRQNFSEEAAWKKRIGFQRVIDRYNRLDRRLKYAGDYENGEPISREQYDRIYAHVPNGWRNYCEQHEEQAAVYRRGYEHSMTLWGTLKGKELGRKVDVRAYFPGQMGEEKMRQEDLVFVYLDRPGSYDHALRSIEEDPHEALERSAQINERAEHLVEHADGDVKALGSLAEPPQDLKDAVISRPRVVLDLPKATSLFSLVHGRRPTIAERFGTLSIEAPPAPVAEEAPASTPQELALEKGRRLEAHRKRLESLLAGGDCAKLASAVALGKQMNPKSAAIGFYRSFDAHLESPACAAPAPAAPTPLVRAAQWYGFDLKTPAGKLVEIHWEHQDSFLRVLNPEDPAVSVCTHPGNATKYMISSGTRLEIKTKGFEPGIYVVKRGVNVTISKAVAPTNAVLAELLARNGLSAERLMRPSGPTISARVN